MERAIELVDKQDKSCDETGANRYELDNRAPTSRYNEQEDAATKPDEGINPATNEN